MRNRHFTGRKRRIATSAAAGLTAISILLSSLFPSPAQLFTDQPQPEPVMVSDTLLPQDEEGQALDESTIPQSKKRKGLGGRLRTLLVQLPFSVRVGFLFPLWCVGWLILQTLSLLWEPLFSPLLSQLFAFIAVASILLLGLFVSMKTVFPDLAVKKIFTRRRIFLALSLSILISLSGVLLSLLFPDIPRFVSLGKAIVFFLAFLLLILPLLCREYVHRRKKSS